MSLCLHRSKSLSKCVGAALQQVAHYNDKFVRRKKQWPQHVNNFRKTKVLRKILKDVEPTPHDTMLEEAVRFSEGEFRAQLLHLREEWGEMYRMREEAARATLAAEHEKSEKERWKFVRKIRKEQKEKRWKPPKNLPHETQSIEEDYRRSQLASPAVEVDSFLQQQSDNTLVTPDTFDSLLDQLLSESNVDEALQKQGGKTRVAPFVTHNIEFVLDPHSLIEG